MSTAHFDATGRLLCLTVLGSDMTPPTGTEYTVEDLETTDPNAIYYDIAAEAVVEKQPFALTIARNLVTGIPAGTKAYYSAGVVTVDDGSLEFEADIEHTEHVMLIHPHYLNAEIAVEVGP